MTPVEMLGLTEFPRIGELPYFLTLGPYAFYWFRLQQAPAPVTARVAPATADDVPHAPGAARRRRVGNAARGQRPHADRARSAAAVPPAAALVRRQGAADAQCARSSTGACCAAAPQPLFLTIVEVEFEDGGARPVLPAADDLRATPTPRGSRSAAPHAMLANITGARKGMLFDALARRPLRARRCSRRSSARSRSTTKRGTRPRASDRRPSPSSAAPADDAARRRARRPSRATRRSSYGDRLILKLFRRARAGHQSRLRDRPAAHREGRLHRACRRVAGAFEYARLGDQPTHAGDDAAARREPGGRLDARDRRGRAASTTRSRATGAAEPSRAAALHRADRTATPPKRVSARDGRRISATAETLGRRTAEMHLALAVGLVEPGVRAGAVHEGRPRALTRGRAAQAQQALADARVARRRRCPDDVAAAASTRLLQSRDTLLERIRSAPALEFAASKIRVHGDYHLGQVLWCRGGLLPARLRRRARASDRTAPAETVAAEGCRRHDAVVQLRRVCRTVRAHRIAAGGIRAARAVGTRLADVDVGRVSARVFRRRPTARFHAGRRRRSATRCCELFVLDKALYELNYELNNRPDWVRIPLRGIFELLERCH